MVSLPTTLPSSVELLQFVQKQAALQCRFDFRQRQRWVVHPVVHLQETRSSTRSGAAGSDIHFGTSTGIAVGSVAWFGARTCHQWPSGLGKGSAERARRNKAAWSIVRTLNVPAQCILGWRKTGWLTWVGTEQLVAKLINFVHIWLIVQTCNKLLTQNYQFITHLKIQVTAWHQLFQLGAFWRQPFCLCRKMHLCCRTL